MERYKVVVEYGGKARVMGIDAIMKLERETSNKREALTMFDFLTTGKATVKEQLQGAILRVSLQERTRTGDWVIKEAKRLHES
jgi:hypothetical protein